MASMIDCRFDPRPEIRTASRRLEKGSLEKGSYPFFEFGTVIANELALKYFRYAASSSNRPRGSGLSRHESCGWTSSSVRIAVGLYGLRTASVLCSTPHEDANTCVLSHE